MYVGHSSRRVSQDTFEHAELWCEGLVRCTGPGRFALTYDAHDHQRYARDAYASTGDALTYDEFGQVAQAVFHDSAKIYAARLDRVLKPYREKRARNNLRRWRGPRIIS